MNKKRPQKMTPARKDQTLVCLVLALLELPGGFTLQEFSVMFRERLPGGGEAAKKAALALLVKLEKAGLVKSQWRMNPMASARIDEIMAAAQAEED